MLKSGLMVPSGAVLAMLGSHEMVTPAPTQTSAQLQHTHVLEQPNAPTLLAATTVLAMPGSQEMVTPAPT
jgi:hypothetical protein